MTTAVAGLEQLQKYKRQRSEIHSAVFRRGELRSSAIIFGIGKGRGIYGGNIVFCLRL